MASSSTSILLLLLITISSPLLHQIHARESQFFSKVTNAPTETETVVLPNKEQEQQSLFNKPETEPQQQPEFVPQNQKSHGLYGQENTETKSGVQTHTPGSYASDRLYNDRNKADTETEETEQFGNRQGETFYVNNGEKYQNRNKADTETEETEQFGNRQGETFYVNNGEKYQNRNKADTETEETEQFGNRQGETFYVNNGEKYQNDDAALDFDDSKDENDDASFYSNNRNGFGTEHYSTYTNQKDNGEKYYYTNKDQNDDASYYNNNYNGVGTEHYTTDSQKDNLGETETYYDESNTDKNQFGSQLSQTETSYNDNGFTNELNTRYNTYRTETIKPQKTGGSNVERQGMSDTRFLENGRYYYDVNKEEKTNQYSNQNTYKYNYNPKSNYDSQFGNREYESNDVDRSNANYYANNKRFYDNSGGEKYEFNTMEEYERSRQNHYDP